MVATVSLGVGVDIRVKNDVCLGLGSSPENVVQEAGRCLRGSQEEYTGLRGLAFFFQKGTVVHQAQNVDHWLLIPYRHVKPRACLYILILNLLLSLHLVTAALVVLQEMLIMVY